MPNKPPEKSRRTCDLCSTVFRSMRQLQQHRLATHVTDLPLRDLMPAHEKISMPALLRLIVSRQRTVPVVRGPTTSELARDLGLSARSVRARIGEAAKDGYVAGDLSGGYILTTLGTSAVFNMKEDT